MPASTLIRVLQRQGKLGVYRLANRLDPRLNVAAVELAQQGNREALNDRRPAAARARRQRRR